jgi:hypothetical protein
LTDPVSLRTQLDLLLELKSSRRMSSEAVEALAECSFRLALHPETEVTEALELLHQSVRLDGANPKYAYHLGRLYFLHGELKAASSWLHLAIRLCPTSHRLWAHISLLQQELNVGYRGDENYEPDYLRKQSQKIAQAIKDGQDQIAADLAVFVPKMSSEKLQKEDKRASAASPRPMAADEPETGVQFLRANAVRRLINPNQCRWSGINDLVIEQLLEAHPSERNLKRLLPLMQEAARAAERRRHGVSAFVILGIQWVLCGYPVATISRLRAELPEEAGSRALALLRLVCRLAEAEGDARTSLIAAALEQGHLPPLLAAVMHQRWVLWRPLEFRGLGTYRAARRFLTDALREAGANERDRRPEQADEYAKRLNRAIDALMVERRTPLQDATPESKAPALEATSGAQTFVLLEESAQRLAQLRDEAFRLLKEQLEPAAKNPPDDHACSQAVADREAFDRLIAQFSQAGKTGLQLLDQLLQTLASLDSTSTPPDFDQRRDSTRSRLTSLCNLGNFERVLNRIDRRLRSVITNFTITAQPRSAELARMLEASASALPTQHAAPTSGEAANTDRPGSLGWKAKHVKEQIEAYWERLRELIALWQKGELGEEELAEAAAINQAVLRAFEEVDESLKDVAAVRALGDISQKDLQVLDTAEKAFQGVLQRRGPFMKNLGKLPFKPSPPAEPAAVPECQSAGFQPEQHSGLRGLASALERADRELERLFSEAAASFNAYSNQARHLPPIRALRTTVRARQAETYYRLGRRREASRLWNELLRGDRLNLAALKNLAVCETAAGDVNRSLNAWRSYLEVLYFNDVACRSPRPNASLRAEFHRDFGHAYAPAILAEKLEVKWDEKLESAPFQSFFGSPGRVRSFVEHKLVEAFNTRLSFTSPTLILGVSRSAGEPLRKTAREKQIDFTARVGPLLPGRIRDAFLDLAQQHIENAFKASSSARRRTLKKDARYPEEESRQIQFLTGLCQLKYKLVLIVKKFPDLVKHITSVDFLEQLNRLDLIPIDTDPALLRPIAGALQISPEMLPELMNYLGENVIENLLKFVFGEPGDPAENALRERQYQRLINDWVKQPSLASYLSRIDDPQFLYEDEIKAAVESNETSPQAVALLRRWPQRFPQITGPVRLLALLLDREEKYEEAIALLDQACQSAFYQAGKVSCYYSRMWAWYKRAGQAFEANNPDETKRCLGPARRDADYVIANSKSEHEVEQAKKVKQQIRQSLGS